ncbi:DUF2125 domain-containing protein [Flexibacterium corallicola]|uniref:DUF2125 domain-containing protein n=1 Tax=Flexibacterium corallicola TaxID=3037259 RepID=UPI00286F809A|nr:DUF2125 domain-containing protein [Pseudovibrio sp. M1P-2-3]
MPQKKSPRSASITIYILVFSFLAVIIGAWSTYWYVGRGVISDLLRNTEEVVTAEGGELTCGDRSIGGYPYRFELSCSPLQMEDGKSSVDVEDFQIISMAYNPRHLIVEAGTPTKLSTTYNGLAYNGTWADLRGSSRLKSEGGLSRMDLVVQQPQLQIGSTENSLRFDAQLLEAHVKQENDSAAGVDIALLVDQLASSSFSTQLPLDIEGIVQVPQGEGILKGKVKRVQDLLKDGKIELNLTHLKVSSGEISLETQGKLTVDSKGRLSGTIPLKIVGVHELARLVEPLFPVGSKVPQSLQNTAMSIGANTKENGKPTLKLPITFEKGRARIAFINLGKVPPLF